MVKHILDCSHCISVHSLFMKWKIWSRYSVVCSVRRNQWRSLSSSEALLCEWGNASKPVHSVYILGEPPQRLWLCLCCSERDSSKVSLSYTSWSPCVHVAAPQTAAAVLPGVSLEGWAWGKKKQKSGFEDGLKANLYNQCRITFCIFILDSEKVLRNSL